MAYLDYATKADLASYLDVEEASLVPDSGRLLKRASELVKQQTRENIEPTNTAHMEAAKYAVCAQVEYWLQEGESVAISPDIKSFGLDGASTTLAESRKGLCGRARSFLSEEGLLYAGVRVGGREVIEK